MLKVYKCPVVLPAVLYACDTWTVYQRHAKIISTSVEEIVKKQFAIQDPRHRGPEEGRGVKHAYYVEASTAEMDYSCFKNS